MLNNKVENEYRYYKRATGVVVRVSERDIVLQVLIYDKKNDQFLWIPNQEWYMSMFADGDDNIYQEVSKDYVENYMKILKENSHLFEEEKELKKNSLS